MKIACSSCGAPVERIRDVGNPWLDAGIVPFSTLNYRHDPEYWAEWFPADWVSESFPGQFRNWFYAMLAIGTVMVLDTPYEGQPPFKNLFSYALLRDENGDEMHKSKGNAIWFEDAAERMGADVMRWMYLRAQPANNLNFGWHGADELKRGFLSTLWNTYSFFVTYANIDGWAPSTNSPSPPAGRGPGGGVSELDRWALSELNQLVGLRDHRSGELRRHDRDPPDRGVRGRALELVCTPFTPPFLEERVRLRQVGRLRDPVDLPLDRQPPHGADGARSWRRTCTRTSSRTRCPVLRRACTSAIGRWPTSL